METEDGGCAGREERLAAVREEMHRMLDQAVDCMFDPGRQDQLVTFAQREALAAQLGRAMSARLIEKHLAADPMVDPEPAAKAERPRCPRCGEPGRRSKTAGKPNAPEERVLLGEVGEVRFDRSRWACPKCRRAFFPTGRSTRTRR